jgi:hypothetical protein
MQVISVIPYEIDSPGFVLDSRYSIEDCQRGGSSASQFLTTCRE